MSPDQDQALDDLVKRIVSDEALDGIDQLIKSFFAIDFENPPPPDAVELIILTQRKMSETGVAAVYMRRCGFDVDEPIRAADGARLVWKIRPTDRARVKAAYARVAARKGPSDPKAVIAAYVKRQLTQTIDSKMLALIMKACADCHNDSFVVTVRVSEISVLVRIAEENGLVKRSVDPSQSSEDWMDVVLGVKRE